MHTDRTAEAGLQIGATPERIKQIEAKALPKAETSDWAAPRLHYVSPGAGRLIIIYCDKLV